MFFVNMTELSRVLPCIPHAAWSRWQKGPRQLFTLCVLGVSELSLLWFPVQRNGGTWIIRPLSWSRSWKCRVACAVVARNTLTRVCVLYKAADETRPPLWPSGSWLQIQRSEFDSRCYHIFSEVAVWNGIRSASWVQLRRHLEEIVSWLIDM
jgi:hypothetical protein